MKWFISFITLILSTGLVAQTTAISIIDNPVVSNLEEIQDRMSERKSVMEYLFVNIDLNSLQNETSIHIDFFDVNAIIYRDRLVRRDSESFSWFGFSEDKSITVVCTVSGTIVNVSILTEFENYKIETIVDHYILERFDLTLISEQTCLIPTIDEDDFNLKMLSNDISDSEQSGRSGEPVETEVSQCKLRILVMYTAITKQKDPNIENSIQAGVDELNLSFLNSNIVGEAELVLMVETDYKEQGDQNPNNPVYAGVLDLHNFRNTSDGYMDNVHVLRDLYSADICVLVYEHPHPSATYSGVAYSIRSSYPNAFCIVNFRNIVSPTFTFSHEIGHLFGARHDDSQYNIPYQYGHGFVTGDKTMQTLMGKSCSACNRVLFWSGPNTYFQGYNLGNSSSSDNARVIIGNFDRMMYLSTINQILTVYNSDVSTLWAKTIYAGGDMLTSGNVVIQWGRNYVFRAEKTIELKAGFEVQTEAQFEAFIEACGKEDFEDTDYKKGSKKTGSVDLISNVLEEGVNIRVYPNPTTNWFNINFADVQINGVTVELFSVHGNRVKIWDVNLNQGNNQFNLDGIAPGTFLLQVSKDGESLKTIQLIKK
tara:strand:- start:2379 stop:4163 length:1785 start_codon:yes stop_codon:yes gene_type:complete